MYCRFCGIKIKETDSDKTTKRETVYEGNIHKCPSCGEVIGSFATKCPSCGHEFRDVNATSSVRELTAIWINSSTPSLRFCALFQTSLKK